MIKIGIARYRLVFIMLIGLIIFGCQDKKGDSQSALIVVNAPAGGVVSRVLSAEGASVKKMSVIFEISPQASPASQNEPSVTISNKTQEMSREIKSAEENLTRASVEVSRMESLISANTAPQAQLDAARADFQKAQERLDKARDQLRKQQAVPGSNPNNQAAAPVTEQKAKIVRVRAPIDGTLKVISIRINQTVREGQPLAVISAENAEGSMVVKTIIMETFSARLKVCDKDFHYDD